MAGSLPAMTEAIAFEDVEVRVAGAGTIFGPVS